MPCNSDYLEPSQKERNTNRVASLLIYVNGKLGNKISKKLKELSKDLYPDTNKLDSLVKNLCRTISTLSKKQLEEIVYNAKSKQSRDLADWWEDHQEADKERLESEMSSKKKAEDITKALSKLTKYERKLLGYEA